MKVSELFNKHYNELTNEARRVIESSDQSFEEFAGEFNSAEEFNLFVKDNYNDEV